MKQLRQLLFILFMLVNFAPVSAAEAEKAEGFDLQSVLWGHVIDS